MCVLIQSYCLFLVLSVDCYACTVWCEHCWRACLNIVAILIYFVAHVTLSLLVYDFYWAVHINIMCLSPLNYQALSFCFPCCDHFWWLFPCVSGFWENVQQFIPCLSFFFFLKVEISSRKLIPLFSPGSVRSDPASWDNCDQVFTDELHVSSFPDRFPHYAWTNVDGSGVYACLGVSRHLHFWQNDRGLLRATAVTWEWNGHRIRVSTQSWPWRRKFFPPLLPGFERTTFRSLQRQGILQQCWARVHWTKAHIYTCTWCPVCTWSNIPPTRRYKAICNLSLSLSSLAGLLTEFCS